MFKEAHFSRSTLNKIVTCNSFNDHCWDAFFSRFVKRNEYKTIQRILFMTLAKIILINYTFATNKVPLLEGSFSNEEKRVVAQFYIDPFIQFYELILRRRLVF